jgi:uncharacterized protein YndB with AHSA1/START domain
MKQETEKRTFVTIQKNFHTSAEEVFDAWLNTGLLGKWMFGPSVREETIVSLTNDPHPGGKFSYKVKRGDLVLDHIGTYLEIERPARLVFTWGVDIDSGDDSIVTIQIQPVENGCTLSLQHDMDIKWEPYADRTKASWTFMLNRLEECMSGI